MLWIAVLCFTEVGKLYCEDVCWTFSQHPRNDMNLNVVYSCALGCLVEPRSDFETALQASH